MFTGALRFGSYRTIVWSPHQPSFEKDDRFGVSLNKLDSRWKQTVFLVVVGNCCTRAWGFGSYQPRVFNYFHKRIVISLLRSLALRADTRRLFHCYLSTAMFPKKQKFDSYRTIILSPKQPSFKKIAASVFHSTKFDDSWKQTVFLVAVR